MALLANTIITDCGLHLNDVAKAVFTNTVLIGYMKNAVRDLQDEFIANGLSFVEEVSSEQTITAGVVIMNTQPTDLAIPNRMYERLSGSTLQNDYKMMTYVDRLPQRDPVAELLEWEFREDTINFIAATTDRQIKLEYMKLLTQPTSINTDIVVALAENYLSYRTSELAAAMASRDMELAAYLGKEADEALEKLLNNYVRNDQHHPARQIPYSRKLRRRFLR